MRSLFFLIISLVIFSCSNSNEEVTIDSITYSIDGIGEIKQIQFSINPLTGATDPRTSSSEIIQNPSLPFTFTEKNYSPDLAQIFVQINNLSDQERIKHIRIIRNGEIVGELTDFTEPNIFPDSYSYNVRVEWGVYLR